MACSSAADRGPSCIALCSIRTVALLDPLRELHHTRRPAALRPVSLRPQVDAGLPVQFVSAIDLAALDGLGPLRGQAPVVDPLGPARPIQRRVGGGFPRLPGVL